MSLRQQGTEEIQSLPNVKSRAMDSPHGPRIGSKKKRVRKNFTDLYRNMAVHKNMLTRTTRGPAFVTNKIRNSVAASRTKRPRQMEFDPDDIVKIVTSKVKPDGSWSFMCKWKPESGKNLTWLDGSRFPASLKEDYLTRTVRI